MKLKIKLKEILLKLDTNFIVFLGSFYVIYVKIATTDTIPLKDQTVLQNKNLTFIVLSTFGH